MARHWWSTFSSFATIDQETNNVSAVDLIEMLRVPYPPKTDKPKTDKPLAILMRSVVVSLWGRTDLDVQERSLGRARWMDAADQEIASFSYEIDLRNHERSRIRLNLSEIPIRDSGIYHWQISFAHINAPDEWQVVAQLPVQVIFDDPAEIAT